MKDESKEMLQDNLLIKARKDSYLNKEDFIKMIENLNFTEVEDARMTFITGYRVNVSDNGNKYVETLGFNINIV